MSPEGSTETSEGVGEAVSDGDGDGVVTPTRARTRVSGLDTLELEYKLTVRPAGWLTRYSDQNFV